MNDMVEVKVSELIGPALDWAVSKIEEIEYTPRYLSMSSNIAGEGFKHWFVSNFRPSTDWSQGGPLIANRGKCIGMELRIAENSASFIQSGMRIGYTASDVLIAACRAIVAAKLGEIVSVPKELMP